MHNKLGNSFITSWAIKLLYSCALSATARKLQVILWNIISKKIALNPPNEYLFPDQKRKLRLVQNIKRNIVKFEIKPEDIGFLTL
jgi:transposase